MKLVFFILCSIVVSGIPQKSMAAQSSVATRKANWEVITSDQNVQVIQPSYASGMGPRGIFNMCATENEFRSIEPVASCEQYKFIQLHGDSTEFGENIDFHCTQIASGQIAITRNIPRDICEKSVRLEDEDKNATCLKTKTVDMLPTDLKLEVVRGRGEAKGQSLFVKNYQIPKC